MATVVGGKMDEVTPREGERERRGGRGRSIVYGRRIKG